MMVALRPAEPLRGRRARGRGSETLNPLDVPKKRLFLSGYRDAFPHGSGASRGRDAVGVEDACFVANDEIPDSRFKTDRPDAASTVDGKDFGNFSTTGDVAPVGCRWRV